MKFYTVYVCEKCKKESTDYFVIKLCEARHMGLNTLEDMLTYETLDKDAGDATARRCNSDNEHTRKAEDEAYQKLFDFLEAHEINDR